MSDDEVPDRLEGLAERLEQRKPWGIATGPCVRCLAPRAVITGRTRHPVAAPATRHAWTGPRSELTNTGYLSSGLHLRRSRTRLSSAANPL